VRGIEQIPWLYDLGMTVIERTGLRRWRQWLAAELPAGPLLDVGCGTGRTLALLHGRTPVVGLDPCREALVTARRRAPQAWLVQARAEHLPFVDESFGVVLSGLVFCSVDDPQAGLAEIRRVLRRGGSLRMLEHVRSTSRWQAWLQDRLQPAWTRLTGGCRPNRETEQAVLDAGFRLSAASRRAAGSMRHFVAHPAGSPPALALDHARNCESPASPAANG
jgi:ubiquinone/menaquinone biosynthesis C-methylase UbiE